MGGIQPKFKDGSHTLLIKLKHDFLLNDINVIANIKLHHMFLQISNKIH